MRRRALLRGKPVRLSRKEFELLRVLVLHAGRVVTHKQLLSEIWGRGHENDVQYLRVYVGYLRQKLGDGLLESVPGVGYRLIVE